MDSCKLLSSPLPFMIAVEMEEEIICNRMLRPGRHFPVLRLLAGHKKEFISNQAFLL